MRRIPLGSGALAAPFFFFNDTATTEIYTLSLHDALPISLRDLSGADARLVVAQTLRAGDDELACRVARGDLVQQVRQGTASGLDHLWHHAPTIDARTRTGGVARCLRSWC